MTNSPGLASLTAAHIGERRITLSDPYGSPTTTPYLLMKVTGIENGMLVHIGFKEGEAMRTFYIKDLSELPDLLAVQVAARKIGV